MKVDQSKMNDNAAVNNTGLHNNLNGGIEDLSTGANDKQPETVQEHSTPKKGASSSNANNSGGRSKKRKKCPRDATAPKQPLTGYFRFLNDRRDSVRNENPTMPFSEITKQLAAEWNMLPTDQKQQYLDAAEQDKERYNREFNDYKQTEAYRLFLEKQTAEKQNDTKKERNGTEAVTTPVEQPEPRSEKIDETGIYDVPIFTEEFLDHNKGCEAELRQLRKATADYESQNAVLHRHVDSLHAAVNRLEAETNQQQAVNQALQRHLESLQTNLVSSFSHIPLTGTFEGATTENIDSYIERLDYVTNTNMEPSLRSAIRTAVSRLDFIK